MINYILFGLMCLSFVFILFSIYFIFKMKIFEDKRLRNGVNCLLIGLCFLVVFLFVKALEYGLNLFSDIDIGFYGILAEIICIGLMIIFFLVGMIVMREVK